jgi:Radical_SAM C-terminal domain
MERKLARSQVETVTLPSLFANSPTRPKLLSARRLRVILIVPVPESPTSIVPLKLRVPPTTPSVPLAPGGEVRLMERPEYVRTLVDFIELLPPTMIVDRISGDAPQDYFIGPSWCLDEPSVGTAVLAESARRGTSQGKYCDIR